MLSIQDWWRAASRDYLRRRAIERIKLQPFFQPNPYAGAKWTAFDIGRFEGDKSVAVEFNRLESGAVRVMRVDELA